MQKKVFSAAAVREAMQNVEQELEERKGRKRKRQEIMIHPVNYVHLPVVHGQNASDYVGASVLGDDPFFFVHCTDECQSHAPHIRS